VNRLAPHQAASINEAMHDKARLTTAQHCRPLFLASTVYLIMATTNEGGRIRRSESSSPLAKPRSTYGYQRLPSRRSIRLLELLPDKRGAPLKCHMREVVLEDAPSYEAVSYVWGTPEFGKQISCGAVNIKITRSCSYALHHLRLEQKSRLLWIDACCINQKSERERNQQVGMMGDIYSKAKSTLIWLGKADASDMGTMFYIRRIGRNILQGQETAFLAYTKSCAELATRPKQ
jgi:hypothetical protein